MIGGAATARTAACTAVLLLAAGGCAARRANPSARPPTASAGTASIPLETCSLLGGEVEVRVPRPAGFAIARSPQACMVAEEHTEQPIFFTVSAVIGAGQAEGAAGGDHKAALLAGPDGAAAWARQSDLFAEPPRQVGNETIEVAGEPVQVYRLVGRPAGMDATREAMVLRLEHGDRYVVVLAFYDPQQDAQRGQVRSLLQAIRWEDRDER